MGCMEGKTAWLFRRCDGYIAADSQGSRARINLWDRAELCDVVRGALFVKGTPFLFLWGRLP